ncbi:DUF4326 domain-containing protein [Nostoc sp. CHAB 5834]|nr:DUF4326 domain-containing protein [Nostoc sp. CHAB 5834]
MFIELTQRTRAVNVKYEEFDVYMGRAMPGYPASKWRNPFREGVDGNRAQVIAKYRAWLLTQPALLADIEELRGLRLGCWCKPKDCHVDFIVELLEGPPPSLIAAEPIQQSLF